VYFVKNGSFLRVPAIDNIPIRRGRRMLVPVNEDGQRLDGTSTESNQQDHYTVVYIPPQFRNRIIGFIGLIWLFAIVSTVAVIFGPLLFGRTLLTLLLPERLKLHDVYSFMLGAYILGGTIFLADYTSRHFRGAVRMLGSAVRSCSQAPVQSAEKATSVLWKGLKLAYMFAAFVFVIPSLFALVMEFYVVIPVHAYLRQDQQPVVYFLQDWTLGVLYMKLIGRFVLFDADSRLARAMRDMVRSGYLNPDVRIATKYFFVPVLCFSAVSLLVPLALAYVVQCTVYRGAAADEVIFLYRYCFPVFLLVAAMVTLGYVFSLLLDNWKQTVRDEVYLVGEELVNLDPEEQESDKRRAITPIGAAEVEAE